MQSLFRNLRICGAREGSMWLSMCERRARLDICRLEGALHIPMAAIPARVDDLPTNLRLAVLRHHGARSQMVVDLLRDAGFGNAANLDGGIEACSAREIDGSMRRYR